MTTRHTCGGPVWGRKTPGCPRCDELLGGATPAPRFPSRYGSEPIPPRSDEQATLYRVDLGQPMLDFPHPFLAGPTGEPAVYTLGEATRVARLFGGRVAPVKVVP